MYCPRDLTCNNPVKIRLTSTLS